ncbi:MAG: hypothetical protein ACOX6T_00160 [Myxococcales bacterium]|jgi:hypothetical protein
MNKAIVALALCLPLFAWAADVLSEHQIERRHIEESLFSFVVHRTTWIPSVPDSLKALPASKRPEVVRALGQLAKAYFSSEAFQKRYAEARQAAQPQKPAPPKPGKVLAAEVKAELERNLAGTEDQIKLLPPDQQATVRQALAEMRAVVPTDPVLLEQAEQARYQDELRRYEEARARQPPEDPRKAVKAGLERFLELCDGVDFKAKLVGEEGSPRRFERGDYESKPNEWKACFRAGKEATEAARAFAREWLKTLE